MIEEVKRRASPIPTGADFGGFKQDGSKKILFWDF